MTYDLIQEQVLGSAAASVTFSNIPQGFKDLVIEITGTATSSAWGVLVQFNGDTGSNYSFTYLVGNGSSAFSGRASNSTSINGLADFTTSSLRMGFGHIFSYSNTNVFKSVIFSKRGANADVLIGAGLWRSTSAITSITLLNSASSSFAAGTNVRLWGVV